MQPDSSSNLKLGQDFGNIWAAVDNPSSAVVRRRGPGLTVPDTCGAVCHDLARRPLPHCFRKRAVHDTANLSGWARIHVPRSGCPRVSREETKGAWLCFHQNDSG
jgi:hypothetical protein